MPLSQKYDFWPLISQTSNQAVFYVHEQNKSYVREDCGSSNEKVPRVLKMKRVDYEGSRFVICKYDSNIPNMKLGE